MPQMLAEMSDDEIYSYLDGFATKLDAGVLDFSNSADVSTNEIVLLAGALDYVKEVDESKFFTYLDLYKTVSNEMLDRAGDIPLQ